MLMTPSPIIFALAIIQRIEIVIFAVSLVPVHVIGPIFMIIPVMVILVVLVVIAMIVVIAIVIMILSNKGYGADQRAA